MNEYKPIYYLIEDCGHLKIESTKGIYKYIEKDKTLSREMMSKGKRKNYLYIGKIVRKSENLFDMIDNLDMIEYNYNGKNKIVCIEDTQVLSKLDINNLIGILKRQITKDYKYFEKEM